MSDYWKNFWSHHADSAQSASPQTQVLRTLNRQPIEEEVFSRIVASILHGLVLDMELDCLDLCCGNGLITTEIANNVRSVVAIDFAKTLIEQIDLERYPNIQTRCSSVIETEFPHHSFDRILLYAGLQYFTLAETAQLFNSAVKWLRPGGMLYIGDIPDMTRIWSFFNSQDREDAYFEALRRQEPIVGTWFVPEWLKRLGRSSGFCQVEVIDQHNDLPFAHYRFDIRLRKQDSPQLSLRETSK